MRTGGRGLELDGQPKTRPAVFGMVLFLASELMFFGGLFAAYYTLRGTTEVWPPSGVELDVLLPAIATAILTASSLTAHRALEHLRGGSRDQAVGWILLTILMGLVFLGIKFHEWAVVPFRVDSHAYGTLFFTMTGAHAAHLAVGLLLYGFVLARLLGGRYSPGDLGAPEAVTYYWHFVDAVWLALFSTIYLVR